METFRKSLLTLPLGNIAAAAAVATFIATHKARISAAQLTLSDSGTGTGATTVVVKVNGQAVTGANDLTLASAGANLAVKADVVVGTQFPGGALINPGDIVTVDITAVPGTNKPKGASVILSLTQVDA